MLLIDTHICDQNWGCQDWGLNHKPLYHYAVSELIVSKYDEKYEIANDV